MEPWIGVIGVIIIVILFIMNMVKKSDINTIKDRQIREKIQFQTEISQLQHEINKLTEDEEQYSNEIVQLQTEKNSLQYEINKQNEDANLKYNNLQQKYFKLMKTYITFRKKLKSM